MTEQKKSIEIKTMDDLEKEKPEDFKNGPVEIVKVKKKRTRSDPHVGCYSWPNCDLMPLGCRLATDDPEPYGFRD